jgi:hypothetical protein
MRLKSDFVISEGKMLTQNTSKEKNVIHRNQMSVLKTLEGKMLLFKH